MLTRIRNIIWAIQASLLLLFAGFHLSGCDSDDPVAPPATTGNIEITVSPADLNAPWAISGPENYSSSGNGDHTLADVEEGSYTLEWLAVAGYDLPTPATDSGELTAGGSLTFLGSYQPHTDNCSLVMDPGPDGLDPSWSITGPNSYTHAGNGDHVVEGLYPGQYNVVWAEVQGFETPAEESITLLSASQDTFTCTYVRPPLPVPSNPDILMQNYQTIYEEFRIDDFRDMLHPDFKTVLLPSTMAEWEGASNPLASNLFNRDVEINIHENIFSGVAGQSPVGVIVPPIDSVNVPYLEKQNAWELIPESDEFFGDYDGYWALYQVLFYFNKPDFSRYMVDQSVVFYVMPVEDGGSTRWQLLGVRGLEPGLKSDGQQMATESISFGSAKALYRN